MKHRHVCSQCGNAWKHDDSSFGVKNSHKCSVCGKMQWWKTPMSNNDMSAKLAFLKSSPKEIAKAAFHHPFTFAAGVGVANGLLAKARDKAIDVPTAATLAIILGLGEMALEAFVPPEKRPPMSLPAIGLWSVAGIAAGLAPFIDWTGEKEAARGLPIAQVKVPLGPSRVGYDD